MSEKQRRKIEKLKQRLADAEGTAVRNRDLENDLLVKIQKIDNLWSKQQFGEATKLIEALLSEARGKITYGRISTKDILTSAITTDKITSPLR